MRGLLRRSSRPARIWAVASGLLNHLQQLGFMLYEVNPFYREKGMEFQETGEGRMTEGTVCLFTWIICRNSTEIAQPCALPIART